MKTLTIKDLPAAETLDGKAMRDVRGGYSRFAPYYWGPSVSIDKKSIVKSAEQLISQTQAVDNMNGNNVAFAHGLASRVAPYQLAQNNVSF